MPLGDIIQKEEIVYTPLAQEIVDSPEEQESKFKFHVATYVAIADMENRWNATVDNLLKGKSATGLIYADTGYGKTSTGASLWNYAELKGLVAVPPFRWDSLTDMLTATHGWVCYRLKDRRQDLISVLGEKYRSVVAVGEEALAQKMSREKRLSVAQSREAIALVKAEGRFRDELSPRGLLDYLRFATQQVLAAGYKGLLILPDEFQLFKNNPDSAQNLSRLKEFIFGIGEEKFPIGCITLTYNETFASIRESESNYMLARFAKPAGNIINLETLYGETEFARHLWDKLADLRHLSSPERSAIDSDVLDALGQFFRHSRSRALISGPRSVVSTFRQAAFHYTEKNRSYSLLDFCKDYLDGIIAFSSQHTEAAQAHARIMALPEVNTPEKRKVVKLLCVHPEGVPPEIFQKYGTQDSDRESFIDILLPEHVITKVAGYPTLACYRDDLHGVDELNEILKRLKTEFNSMNRTLHQSAVGAFRKHVLPEILTAKKQGALLGWTGIQESSENWDGGCTISLTGTLPNLREYPNRTLRVDIGTEEVVFPPSTPGTQLQVQFIFDVTGGTTDTCHVTTSSIAFRFDIQKSINPQKVPEEIGKLKDLFLPESITPLLLLSILDFFDKESTISIVKGAKQEVQVESLKNRILGELVRYFFSPEVKECAVESSVELVSVPTGKGFVENVLKVLIPERFPDYHAVAISRGWDNDLGKYRDALIKGYSLGVRKGIEPIKGGARLFNIGQVAFDNFSSGVARHLLKVKRIPGIRDEQNVFFFRHPLEKLWVAQLRDSSETIVVNAKDTNAVKLPSVYQHAKRLGYLGEEVNALLKILKARGMADIKKVEGIDYLYLVETSINFPDLKIKLEEIEESITLAESNGFTYQCDNLYSARMLTGTLGIENDEVQKDGLRQKLNSVEAHLKNKCAEWLKTGHQNLRQKINDLETLHLQVPPVLEHQTGHPLTEFSQILFQSVQPEVKSAYTKISDEIRKIQAGVREICDREVQAYELDNTLRVAIETAVRLQQACHRFDIEIEKLNQARADTQELHRLFDPWRILAIRAEDNKQLMIDSQADSDVKNLIERLDAAQRDIRQHLANNQLTLKDVLGSHEHFKTQVDEIHAEFTQLLTGKKDKFIEYQSQIAERLKSLLGQPQQPIDFNPFESEGCYRKVRENAVGKLRSVIDEVLSENNSRQRELLKPIEVFNVPEMLRTRAIQLREALEKLAEGFRGIRHEFTTEEVDRKLSEWVDRIVLKLEEGQVISGKRRQIERELDELVPDPSPKAKRLRDELASQQATDFTELIVRLLGNQTFNSTTEILESLEELYQANLVNLTVHRK